MVIAEGRMARVRDVGEMVGNIQAVGCGGRVRHARFSQRYKCLLRLRNHARSCHPTLFPPHRVCVNPVQALFPDIVGAIAEGRVITGVAA